MYCFRLCRRRFRALDGAGARAHGGRWNSPGKAVVYACANRALAALEFLTRASDSDAPADLLLLTIEIPDPAPLERLLPPQLPGNWQTIPAPRTCQRLGDQWLAEGQALVLDVPSVLVPEESNWLINPRHADFAGIRVAWERPFSFDPRLVI